jgi:hypothetical protein
METLIQFGRNLTIISRCFRPFLGTGRSSIQSEQRPNAIQSRNHKIWKLQLNSESNLSLIVLTKMDV